MLFTRAIFLALIDFINLGLKVIFGHYYQYVKWWGHLVSDTMYSFWSRHMDDCVHARIHNSYTDVYVRLNAFSDICCVVKSLMGVFVVHIQFIFCSHDSLNSNEQFEPANEYTYKYKPNMHMVQWNHWTDHKITQWLHSEHFRLKCKHRTISTNQAQKYNDHYFVGLAFVNGTVNRLKERYNERTRDFLTLIC